MRSVESRQSGRRRGFTLVEMVVSVAVLSLIVVGLSSAIVLATKALPTTESPAERAIKTADVAQLLMGEVRYATSLGEIEPQTVSFTVPDRTGDGLPDTISYDWSGIVGDPLTRRLNGGVATAALPGIHALDLAYDTESFTEMVAGAGESTVTTLTSHSGYFVAPVSITAENWRGQFFRPNLPADATEWRIVGVGFYAMADSPQDGEVAVQIQEPTAGNLPSGLVLTETTLSAHSLPTSPDWVAISLDDAPRLPADEGACLVIRHLSGDNPCAFLIDFFPSPPISEMAYLKTVNGGQTWTTTGAYLIPFQVWGTYSTLDMVGEVTRTFVHRVTLTVQCDSDTAADIHSGARLLNSPEVIER